MSPPGSAGTVLVSLVSRTQPDSPRRKLDQLDRAGQGSRLELGRSRVRFYEMAPVIRTLQETTLKID